MKLVNGELLPLTAEEITQRDKDNAESAAQREKTAADLAQYEKDRTDGIAKLEALGLTLGQAKAVAHKK